VLLVIFMGSDAEIDAGHNITFFENTDCENDSICTKYDNYPMTSQMISIEEASDPVAVEAFIMGPAGFGRCTEVTIILTTSGGGGRDLNISWSIPEVVTSSDSCNITAGSTDTIIIDANCTDGDDLEDGVWSFSVYVESWLGSTTSATFNTTFSFSYIPEVSLRGSNTINLWNPLDALEIPINVDMPACIQTTSYDFTFYWQQSIGDYTADTFGWSVSDWAINSYSVSLGYAITRKNLVIQSGNLLYEEYYVFVLSVTGDDRSNDYTVIGIRTDYRPMPDPYEIVDEQPLTSDLAINISALDWFQWSDSRIADDWWEDETLDASSEVEAILYLYTINWSCNEVSDGVLSECDPDPLEFQNSDIVTLSYDTDDSEKYFNEVGKVLRFTVNITDSYNRSAYNYVDYYVTARYYPEMVIYPNSVIVNQGDMTQVTVYAISSGTATPNGVIAASLDPDEIISRYSIDWETSGDSFSLSEDTGALTEYSTVAAIDSTASDFSTGATYTLKVTLTPSPDYSYEGTISTYATVIMNDAPSSGTCELDLYQGTAFDTEFTISCSNWADDDSPLAYSFTLVTIDEYTGDELSSSPLINLSEYPSFTFSTSAGVFQVETTISDNVGGTTSVTSDILNVTLDTTTSEMLESDPAVFLDNLTSSVSEESYSQASAGDLSSIASSISQMDSTLTLVSSLNLTSTNSSMLSMREQMAYILDTLLDNLVPTLDTFTTLVDILETVVSVVDELGEDSVSTATATTLKIIEALIEILAEDTIANFPTDVVSSLVKSSTNMMIKGTELDLTDELTELIDAAQTVLLESLTDTLPGQNGFEQEDTNTKSKAQRRTPDEIAEVSTEYADLPTFTSLNSSDTDSIDTILRSDTFNVYNQSTEGDVVSVNLYNSTASESERRRRTSGARRRSTSDTDAIELSDIDECEPIILVIATTAFSDPTSYIGTSGAPNLTNSTIELPNCQAIPTSDPTAEAI
jgi:hypothetical protein